MKISVIGVGYVGIHNVINLAKKDDEVIAFDINQGKIDKYNQGIDPTNEYGNDEIKTSKAKFTSDEKDLEGSDIFIICVPTDVDENQKPTFGPLVSASQIVSRTMTKDAIVVYESTVYPGQTREICMPHLESKYTAKVVYTPERISPGDNISLERINRVIGGDDQEAVNTIIEKYFFVPNFEKVESIEIAEAAKILENTQRDVNIALMNSLEKYFNHKNIDFSKVIKAAATKWNFYEVYPGLVGGHCISVDPNYLIYDMDRNGYCDTLVHDSRKINESRVEVLLERYKSQYNKDAKLLVVGATYKKNTNDFRNSLNLKLMQALSTHFPNAIFYEKHYENDIKLEIDLKNDLEGIEYDEVLVLVNHDYVKDIKGAQ